MKKVEKMNKKMLEKWLDVLNEVADCMDEYVNFADEKAVKTLNKLNDVIDEIYNQTKK